MDEIAAPGILAYKAGECFVNLVSLINELPAGRDISSTTLENLLQQYVMSISPLIIFTTDIMPGIGFSFDLFHTFSRPGRLSACTSAPAALRGVGGGGGKEYPNCDDTISTVMTFICFFFRRGTYLQACQREKVLCGIGGSLLHFNLISEEFVLSPYCHGPINFLFLHLKTIQMFSSHSTIWKLSFFLLRLPPSLTIKHHNAYLPPETWRT